MKKFSKKILGKKEATYLMPHRISVKLYENGAVIKPIGNQGMSLSQNEELNQEAIFLTGENLDFLYSYILMYRAKKEIADKLIDSNKEMKGGEFI